MAFCFSGSLLRAIELTLILCFSCFMLLLFVANKFLLSSSSRLLMVSSVRYVSVHPFPFATRPGALSTRKRGKLTGQPTGPAGL